MKGETIVESFDAKISSEPLSYLIRESERCEIIHRMLDRGMIITDSNLRVILNVEVTEDEHSI